MALPFGPWMDVPRERQTICAVADCIAKGEAQVCLYDGSVHHHGCIHYDCSAADVTEHGLKFRPNGWGLLCTMHYEVLAVAFKAWMERRAAVKGSR